MAVGERHGYRAVAVAAGVTLGGARRRSGWRPGRAAPPLFRCSRERVSDWFLDAPWVHPAAVGGPATRGCSGRRPATEGTGGAGFSEGPGRETPGPHRKLAALVAAPVLLAVALAALTV